MATVALTAARSNSTIKWLAGGFAGGMAMAMWEMIAEGIIPNGAGFWAAPSYIGATLLRNLQTLPRPVPFDALDLSAGVMGHMMNSLVFGLIFVWLIAPRFRSLAGQVIAGLAYSLVIFGVMWLAVVPVLDPVMMNLNAGLFLVGHMMYGIALGAVNYWVTARS
ncbi:MAG TPA: hypothetical protein VIV15_07570 [Anaerolineales bacterium]